MSLPDVFEVRGVNYPNPIKIETLDDPRYPDGVCLIVQCRCMESRERAQFMRLGNHRAVRCQYCGTIISRVNDQLGVA